MATDPWEKLGDIVGELDAGIGVLMRERDQLRALATCRCGDGFTADDPGLCGNCVAARDTGKAVPLLDGAEEERLRAFVADLFAAADWPKGPDIDAGEFEELAEKHGLLKPETRTAPCAENCFCAQSNDDMAAGVICYRKVEWLEKASEPISEG